MEKCVPSGLIGTWQDPLMKTQCRYFEKVNTELPVNESYPQLGLSPEKMRIKSHRLAILHSSNIYHSQHLEATKMSINRGMHKEEVVHVQNGILLH